MLEDVINKETLKDSLAYLLSRKDTCGMDGVRIVELPEFLDLNEDKLLESIYDGTYVPGYVKQFDLVSKKGKQRTISVLNSVDKLVCGPLYKYLLGCLSEYNVEHSYAYQKGKGVLSCVKQCRSYIEDGYQYVVHIDIESYFDSIDHGILIHKLDHVIDDQRVLMLINKFLEVTTVHYQEIEKKHKGVLQGMAMSGLLGNYYLYEVDQYLLKHGCKFVRYSDDIKVFVHTYAEGVRVLDELLNLMKNKLNLRLNKNKSEIMPVLKSKYFNYYIRQNEGHYILKKSDRVNGNYYNDWTRKPIQQSNGELYILEDGILGKNDMTLLFENESLKKYFPIELTNSINVYSDVVFDTSFFNALNEKRIGMNLYDKYGRYIGSFNPASSLKAADLLPLQLEALVDETTRLAYAKTMEITALRNILSVIRYYHKKQKTKRTGKAIHEIQERIKLVKQASSVNELLLLEAQAREFYYSCFDVFIKNKAFNFNKRTKRPPKNEVNALISFGNVFLYNRISEMIHCTRLDNRIAVIHSSKRRIDNLCLDFADLYKPIVVDRTIFRMINKKMLTIDHFEQVGSDGIYLNDEGKYLFILELKKTLRRKVRVGKHMKSYKNIIRDDMYTYIHSLKDSKIEYRPYICTLY